MKPIDLVDFAEHSVRIPPRMLNNLSAAPKKASAWKTCLASWIDLLVVSTVSKVIVTFLAASNTVFLTSRNMQKAVTTDFQTFASVFTVMLVTYYFFCFFMNHGQTIGLFTIKKRLPLQDKNFNSAFKWAIICSLNCMTGGLAQIYFELSAKLATHDYLYRELLTQKDSNTFKLLHKIEASKEIREFEEAYKKAA